MSDVGFDHIYMRLAGKVKDKDQIAVRKIGTVEVKEVRWFRVLTEPGAELAELKGCYKEFCGADTNRDGYVGLDGRMTTEIQKRYFPKELLPGVLYCNDTMDVKKKRKIEAQVLGFKVDAYKEKKVILNDWDLPSKGYQWFIIQVL
jgi:hypothetical protein